MELCKNCNSNEIKYVKRRLCKSCYGLLYRQGLLDKIPEHVERAYRLQNIRKKFGVEFLKDIKKINTLQFYGLSSVAEKYGVSREYIRQIHKTIYGKGFVEYERKKKKDRLALGKTVCFNDPRHKVADFKKGSTTYKGAAAEKKLLDRCLSLGLQIDFSCLKIFDIIINGYKVDVKSSYINSSMGTKGLINQFFFLITPTQREVCDFFLCYIAMNDKFYIIENNEKGIITCKYRKICINTDTTQLLYL